jgi:hypothetical protein
MRTAGIKGSKNANARMSPPPNQERVVSLSPWFI